MNPSRTDAVIEADDFNQWTDEQLLQRYLKPMLIGLRAEAGKSHGLVFLGLRAREITEAENAEMNRRAAERRGG